MNRNKKLKRKNEDNLFDYEVWDKNINLLKQHKEQPFLKIVKEYEDSGKSLSSGFIY